MAVVVQGLEAVLARLDRLGMRASSDRIWQSVLGSSIKTLRRYAARVSPVVSGSYRSAHATAMEGKTATLFIDPAARNGNIPVTRYAGNVEAIHHVYARTARMAGRATILGVRDLLQEIVR